ncbi:isoprenyl transferase [Spirochaeta africana]|uniref:Isoprenyl transferase n=1 Tax=Spirochaeta africana (strain ATCC 700263 / DSM 8902 / Z-7692) TaxID=889378 RepID=H9UKJ6_SPIAZ|nr:isoprenyl transferase [Spirochaeta africana]AFG38039.1 undecaprenyl diphosphate synthase [Spirochaeta africana DSM 8902]
MKQSALPQHIGIIMDGNGRWAKKRFKPRTAGHQQGLKTAKRIVKAAREIGIPYLTLYAFSTENWKRAQDEVSFLINLIHTYLRKELDFYRENRVRIVYSGDAAALPAEIRDDIRSVMNDTAGYDGLTVNLALNYGGRNEIARAAQAVVIEHPERDFTRQPISETDIRQHLDTAALPDPDLIIRTGGDLRLSNFLLWGSAYSELYFTKILWPDFSERDLRAAVQEFQRRTRRFGGVHE